MLLTTQSDYALRTPTHLATRPGQSTTGQVAGLFGVSANHVAKIVNLLARLRYFRRIRGVGGEHRTTRWRKRSASRLNFSLA